MIWSSDPVADAERYDREQYNRIRRRPVCYCCDEHITDDFAYKIGKKVFCKDCIDSFKFHIEEDEDGYCED